MCFFFVWNSPFPAMQRLSFITGKIPCYHFSFSFFSILISLRKVIKPRIRKEMDVWNIQRHCIELSDCFTLHDRVYESYKSFIVSFFFLTSDNQFEMFPLLPALPGNAQSRVKWYWFSFHRTSDFPPSPTTTRRLWTDVDAVFGVKLLPALIKTRKRERERGKRERSIAEIKLDRISMGTACNSRARRQRERDSGRRCRRSGHSCRDDGDD